MAMGPSKIQAVNDILLAIGESGAFSAVTSSGSWPALTYTGSKEGQIERLLDRMVYKVQSEGTVYNVQRAKTYTASGSPAKISLSDDTLHVVPVGRSQHRNIIARNNYLWDYSPGRSGNPDEFTSSEQIDVDWYFLLPFDQCSPPLKELIIARAKAEAQRMYVGNLQMDSVLQSDAARGTQVPNSPVTSQNATPAATLSTVALPAIVSGGGGQRGQA